MLNYQGRIKVEGTSYQGNGEFRFCLVDGDGTTTYWSNDGTSTGGAMPTASVTLPVTRGLYATLLGDASVGMSPIPPEVFAHGDVRLRVWFDDGVHGPQLLTPDQRIVSVGYALSACRW